MIDERQTEVKPEETEMLRNKPCRSLPVPPRTLLLLLLPPPPRPTRTSTFLFFSYSNARPPRENKCEYTVMTFYIRTQCPIYPVMNCV